MVRSSRCFIVPLPLRCRIERSRRKLHLLMQDASSLNMVTFMTSCGNYRTRKNYHVVFEATLPGRRELPPGWMKCSKQGILGRENKLRRELLLCSLNCEVTFKRNHPPACPWTERWQSKQSVIRLRSSFAPPWLRNSL